MDRVIKRRGFSRMTKDATNFKDNDPTKYYSIGEEILNAVTHGVGSLAAIIATTVLVVLCALYSNGLAVLISLIYGCSLILLYTMSTIYHSMQNKVAKKVFRVLDHTSINILIAGSYTPVTLIALGDTWKGPVLCIAVWVLAILGVVLSAVSIKKFKVVTMVLYVLMGWACIFIIEDVISALPSTALWFLVAGGITYTVGIAFYSLKRIKFMHGIWHFFVLGGSVLQFICIAFYVIPMTFVWQ